jgi:hypothetical protein
MRRSTSPSTAELGVASTAALGALAPASLTAVTVNSTGPHCAGRFPSGSSLSRRPYRWLRREHPHAVRGRQRDGRRGRIRGRPRVVTLLSPGTALTEAGIAGHSIPATLGLADADALGDGDWVGDAERAGGGRGGRSGYTEGDGVVDGRPLEEGTGMSSGTGMSWDGDGLADDILESMASARGLDVGRSVGVGEELAVPDELDEDELDEDGLGEPDGLEADGLADALADGLADALADGLTKGLADGLARRTWRGGGRAHAQRRLTDFCVVAEATIGVSMPAASARQVRPAPTARRLPCGPTPRDRLADVVLIALPLRARTRERRSPAFARLPLLQDQWMRLSRRCNLGCRPAQACPRAWSIRSPEGCHLPVEFHEVDRRVRGQLSGNPLGRGLVHRRAEVDPPHPIPRAEPSTRFVRWLPVTRVAPRLAPGAEPRSYRTMRARMRLFPSC